jgi:cytochrome c-type biogenesis protein CcmH/NrfF
MVNFGFDFLCSRLGGFWCYWPPWTDLLGTIFLGVIGLTLIAIIIWIIQKRKYKKFR